MDDDTLAHYLEKGIEALVMTTTELEADVRAKRNRLTRTQTALRAFKAERDPIAGGRAPGRGPPPEWALRADRVPVWRIAMQ